MVVINLKSQFVSLIVTVLSGAAELFLFGAALGFNRYAECNALRRGRPVSVRFHRTRTKFLAVFAMVVFIILEVIMSFFSDPALSRKSEPRRCVAVDRYDFRTDAIYNTSTDSVMITCIRVDDDQTFQRVGNRSLEDPTVRCSKSSLYRWFGDGRLERPLTANLTRSCRPPSPGFFPGQCVFTELRGREFLVSALLLDEELEQLIEEQIPIPFLVTILSFDIGTDQEIVLAGRALQAYDENVNDPLELRRRTLTGSEATTCPFFLTSDATEVPLGLIWAIAVSWVLSVLAFVSTLLFKRQIFYDMGDPLHWAQRTYRNIDEPISGNPVVTSVYEHGERLMYVSSSSSDEYDFLRKVGTGLRDKFRSKRSAAAADDVSVEEQRV